MAEEIEIVKAKVKPARRIKFNWRKLMMAFGIILLVGASSGLSSYLTATIITTQQKSSNTTISITDEENVVRVVNQVSKSVVSISTKTSSYGWFGMRYTTEGAGTGIVINKDGYILTNNHVIEGSDTVMVLMHDDSELAATIIATDSSKDLALLKVTAKTELYAATIGNSDETQVGEEVIAVGNALGKYRNSVTKGIISGLGRPIITSGSSLYGDLHELDDLIQTDTAINSGNSGGPLVNMKGEVIGINTAIVGQAQNIGFSVPINHAKELLQAVK